MAKDKDNFNVEDDFGGITFTDLDESESELETESGFGDFEYSDAYKKKKKRKKKRYLLKFIIFLLVLAALIVFLRSDYFNISKINVRDNTHYTEEQIIELSGIKLGDNMFAFTLRGIEKKLIADPYIDTVELKRIIPNTLEISVNERKEKVVIPYEDQFIVADYDGMILRIADKAPDLTVISSLVVEKPEPGAALEATETEILTDTLNLLKGTEGVGLYFKKVAVSKHSFKAYIYDSFIVEGSYDSVNNIDGILEYLSTVVDNLHKKKITRGTIQICGNGDILYQPEVDTKET